MFNYDGSSSRVTTCGAYRVVGGHGLFGQFAYAGRRLKNLPPHYSARIKLNFLKIDSWDEETFYISVDNNFVLTDQNLGTAVTPSTPDQCGMAEYAEVEKTLSVSFSHSSSKMNFIFMSDLNEDSNNESWGFSKVELVVYKCFGSCTACDGPAEHNCLGCPPCGVDSCGEYYFLVTPVDPCQCKYCVRCHISCKTCSGPSAEECLSCESEDVYSEALKTCSYPSSKNKKLN